MIASRRSGARWQWAVWALLVIAAGFGLRGYRIDNDISRWTPALTGSAGRADFVLIGFDRGTVAPAALAARLREQPAVRGVVPVAGDGAMDGLLVLGHPDVGGSSLLHGVRDAADLDADRVALAGHAVFREALDDWSQRGLPVASGLMLVIGAIVMTWTTRRWRPVAESVVAVFSSQIVLVGIISATGTPMDMVLSMTPPLLIGLGFSFAAHRATRFGVNRALKLSMITTGLALATFAFTDFQPIRSFAVWGAGGVLIVWVAVMLVVSPSTPSPPSTPAGPPRRSPSPFYRSKRPAWAVVVAGLAVSIAGLALLPRLDLQEDTITYFPQDARIAVDYRRLDRELTGTLPFQVVVQRSDADPIALLEATDGVRRVVRTSAPGEGVAVTYLGLASSDAVPQLAAAQPRWQAWARANRVRLRWEGVAAQLDHIGSSVWRTAMWALPAMLAVAGLAAFLVDRRWTTVALSVWINGFPVAVLSLLVNIGGRPIGLPTLIISALAIGVAIDDTLHLLIAKRELGSWTQAISACRRACIGSSIATAACMSTFLICPFRPTSEFGMLMATSVLAALVGDLVLLPAAARLLSSEDPRPDRSGPGAVTVGTEPQRHRGTEAGRDVVSR